MLQQWSEAMKEDGRTEQRKKALILRFLWNFVAMMLLPDLKRRQNITELMTKINWAYRRKVECNNYGIKTKIDFSTVH